MTAAVPAEAADGADTARAQAQPKTGTSLPGPTLADAPTGRPPIGRRIGRFASVGASGAVVNLAVLAALVHLLSWPAVLAALVSIEASTIWNHHWNRRWTWGERGAARSLWRYHVVTAGAMAIQWTTVLVGTMAIGLPVLVAAALGIGAATAWNYIGNDRFSFAASRATDPSPRLVLAHRGVLYAATAFALVVGAALLWHPWDTYVMQESTRAFLIDGTTPYETARDAPDHIYPSASLPAVAQWYAYPPLPLLLLAATYWPSAAGLLPGAVLGRVLIKLPVIAATLALPLAAARFLRTTQGDAGPGAAVDGARRIERLLLLNPLIFLVAVVWGQFEAIALVALIGSFAALRVGRTGLAGGLWGAALLVKILPLYLAPLLLVHLWRRFGVRDSVRFFLAGGAVFAAVCLPFLLFEPIGFYQQVLGMHLGRPPARFAPLSAVYYLLRWLGDGGALSLPLDSVIDALSLGSFLLTLAAIGLVAVASTRWPSDEPTLLWASGITMLVALLATKVLNEQYLVLPIGLLALAACHPHGPSSPAAMPRTAALLRWGPAAVAVASLIDNYHFLTFIAPDVLEGLSGSDANAHAARLAWTMGLSLLQLQLGLDLLVGAILLAVFVAVLPNLRHVARDAATALWPLLPRPHLPTPTRRREVVLVHTVLLAIAFPVFAVGMAPGTDSDEIHVGARAGTDPTLLALYTTHWFNPSQDPTIRDGTWEHAQTTPLIGHYTVNARRASEDVTTMQRLGLRGVVVSYEPVTERQAHTAVAVAREHGLPHALLVNVAPHDERVPMTHASIDETARLLRGPGLDYWAEDGKLRIGPDAAPLVLIDGLPRLGFTFSDAELRYVTSVPDAGTDGMAPAAAPTTIPELFAPTTTAAEWRTLYRNAQAAWWDEVLQRADVPTETVIIATGVPILSVHATHGTWLQHGTPDPIGFRLHRLGTDPLGPNGLERQWHDATHGDDPADAILLPWNQHHLGRAIEPTHTHGTTMRDTLTMLTR